ncbi:MAG: protease modulator HflK [Victivallaceae bacterium]|nr:protease modulator HflK [Victivallaceae bacterium]
MDNSKEKRALEPTGLFDLGQKALIRLSKALFLMMVVIITGMLIYYITASGLCSVKPQEAAIVLRFGKYVTTHTEGWHWYPPAPIYSFVYVQTSQQRLDVSFEALRERQMVGVETGSTNLVPGSDFYLLTGDSNIIHTSWRTQYRVTNPKKYYEAILGPKNPLRPDQVQVDPITNVTQGIRGPETMIRNILGSVILKTTASSKVDSLLYEDKEAYRNEVTRGLIAEIAKIDAGIEIDGLQLNQVQPPLPTRKAFSEVTEANQIRGTLIEQAEQYRVNLENDTQVQAQLIRSYAETYSTKVVAQVESESIYFKNIYEQYKDNPGTVLTALYNNTLTNVLSTVDEKYIISSSGDKHRQVRLKINPEPKRTAVEPEGAR